VTIPVFPYFHKVQHTFLFYTNSSIKKVPVVVKAGGPLMSTVGHDRSREGKTGKGRGKVWSQ